MQHPLKIASTLADETRFSIYEKILQAQQSFTVQQIAELFDIHPNVARLHLTKLTEIGVIVAELEKTGKGGRPGRVYRASSEAITLSFPKRENQQLIDWTLKLIDKLGTGALELGKEISYEDGFQSMQQFMLSKNTKSIDHKLAILNEAASLIGYIPVTKKMDDKVSIQFTIYNCPYADYITNHRELICQLHEAFLRGQMDALFGQNDFIQYEKMNAACQYCHYDIHAKI